MGRVSRDARLTFIELWTLADDAGRLRGNSRMLASLLFPYDDDAKELIEVWLAELEREHCIKRYEIEGARYIQICNWLSHQKIDKPSQSKLPEFTEDSRKIAKDRDASFGDQGSRIKEGKGEDQGTPPPAASSDDVQKVFEHWQITHGHQHAELDRKRRSRIVDGLKKHSVTQLCNSISGYLNSPHHMGTDARGNGTKYDDVELFLRDAKRIEAGLKMFMHPPNTTGKSNQAMQPIAARKFPS